MSIFQDSMTGVPPNQKANITPSIALQLLRTIAHVDNFVDPFPFFAGIYTVPLLGSVAFWSKYILTHGIYTFVSALGSALGYSAWIKEYTPRELWEVAERGGVRSSIVKKDLKGA